MNKTSKIVFLLKQAAENATIYRSLFNWEVYFHCANLSGKALDLASGEKPSYHNFLPKDLKLTRTNYKPEKVEVVMDFNKPFPFKEEEFDHVLFFNAIYIADRPVETLKEIRRVLKSDGTMIMSAPFITNEMPEPHDFWRFTQDGLKRTLDEAGFREYKIIRFGGRFSSALYLVNPAIPFAVLKMIFYPLVVLLDKLVPASALPAPLGYLVIASK